MVEIRTVKQDEDDVEWVESQSLKAEGGAAKLVRNSYKRRVNQIMVSRQKQQVSYPANATTTASTESSRKRNIIAELTTIETQCDGDEEFEWGDQEPVSDKSLANQIAVNATGQTKFSPRAHKLSIARQANRRSVEAREAVDNDDRPVTSVKTSEERCENRESNRREAASNKTGVRGSYKYKRVNQIELAAAAKKEDESVENVSAREQVTAAKCQSSQTSISGSQRHLPSKNQQLIRRRVNQIEISRQESRAAARAKTEASAASVGAIASEISSKATEQCMGPLSGERTGSSTPRLVVQTINPEELSSRRVDNQFAMKGIGSYSSTASRRRVDDAVIEQECTFDGVNVLRGGGSQENGIGERVKTATSTGSTSTSTTYRRRVHQLVAARRRETGDRSATVGTAIGCTAETLKASQPDPRTDRGPVKSSRDTYRRRVNQIMTARQKEASDKRTMEQHTTCDSSSQLGCPQENKGESVDPGTAAERVKAKLIRKSHRRRMNQIFEAREKHFIAPSVEPLLSESLRLQPKGIEKLDSAKTKPEDAARLTGNPSAPSRIRRLLQKHHLNRGDAEAIEEKSPFGSESFAPAAIGKPSTTSTDARHHSLPQSAGPDLHASPSQRIARGGSTFQGSRSCLGIELTAFKTRPHLQQRVAKLLEVHFGEAPTDKSSFEPNLRGLHRPLSSAAATAEQTKGNPFCSSFPSEEAPSLHEARPLPPCAAIQAARRRLGVELTAFKSSFHLQQRVANSLQVRFTDPLGSGCPVTPAAPASSKMGGDESPGTAACGRVTLSASSSLSEDSPALLPADSLKSIESISRFICKPSYSGDEDTSSVSSSGFEATVQDFDLLMLKLRVGCADERAMSEDPESSSEDESTCGSTSKTFMDQDYQVLLEKPSLFDQSFPLTANEVKAKDREESLQNMLNSSSVIPQHINWEELTEGPADEDRRRRGKVETLVMSANGKPRRGKVAPLASTLTVNELQVKMHQLEGILEGLRVSEIKKQVDSESFDAVFSKTVGMTKRTRSDL